MADDLVFHAGMDISAFLDGVKRMMQARDIRSKQITLVERLKSLAADLERREAERN
jgi:hypothetical protein